MRIVTWNVWGLHGPWREREAAIVATLQDVHPDIVVLTESWAKGGDSQCARLAGPLGLPHHAFSGVAAQEDEAALSAWLCCLAGLSGASPASHSATPACSSPNWLALAA